MNKHSNILILLGEFVFIGCSLTFPPLFSYLFLLSPSLLPLHQTPENDIHYTVALLAVSGDARLSSSSTQATLTVRHNDDPINLRNSSIQSSEGDTVEVVVTRGGHANGGWLQKWLLLVSL